MLAQVIIISIYPVIKHRLQALVVNNLLHNSHSITRICCLGLRAMDIFTVISNRGQEKISFSPLCCIKIALCLRMTDKNINHHNIMRNFNIFMITITHLSLGTNILLQKGFLSVVITCRII